MAVGHYSCISVSVELVLLPKEAVLCALPSHVPSQVQLAAPCCKIRYNESFISSWSREMELEESREPMKALGRFKPGKAICNAKGKGEGWLELPS